MKLPLRIVMIVPLLSGCTSNSDKRLIDCPYPTLPAPIHTFCQAPQPGSYRVTEGPFCDVIIADGKSIRLARWCSGKLTSKESQAFHLSRFPDAEALQALANGVPEAEIIQKFGPPHLIQTCDQMTMIYAFGGLAQTHYPDEKRAEYRFFTAGPHGEMSELTLHVMYPRHGNVNKTCRVEWRINGHKVAHESIHAKGR